MFFSLIKDASNLSMYGHIPEITRATEDEAETYRGDFEDGLLLCDYLLPEMDKRIKDCLVDIGDLDYFDKDRCVILREILKEKLEAPPTPRLQELYTILDGYVKRAIELDTGVVLEF